MVELRLLHLVFPRADIDLNLEIVNVIYYLDLDKKVFVKYLSRNDSND